MSNQNIYDNQEFFEGYYALRKNEVNYNNLLEQPAMEKMIPDLTGKVVLDLGCGYGKNCREFIEKGVSRVVGIDISTKMLEIAMKETKEKNIEYINMSMSNLDRITEKFDFVYSSLAFHYMEDFKKLMNDIHGLLKENGQILYSQEHPIATASKDGKSHFNRNEKGERVSYTFSHYNESGKRENHWFVDGVIVYHRPISEIITTMAKAGIIIEEVVEPVPEDWAIEKFPEIEKERIKPNFLIVKGRKA